MRPMSKFPFWWLLPCVLLFLLAAMTRADDPALLAAGTAAPDFTLQTLDGKSVPSRASRGRPCW